MKIRAKNIAKALFDLAFKDPQNIPKIAQDFYFYLLKKRKSKMLPQILEKLNEVEREKAKTKEIEVETTLPLTFAQKRNIQKSFKKKVLLKERVNPSLLGGIVLKTDDTLVDGSLKNNLERLKEEMWQIPIK